MEIAKQLDDIISNIPAPAGFGKPVVKVVYSEEVFDLNLSWRKGVGQTNKQTLIKTLPVVSHDSHDSCKVNSAPNVSVKETSQPPVDQSLQKHKCPSRYRRDQKRWYARRKKPKYAKKQSKSAQSRFFAHSTQSNSSDQSASPAKSVDSVDTKSSLKSPEQSNDRSGPVQTDKPSDITPSTSSPPAAASLSADLVTESTDNGWIAEERSLLRSAAESVDPVLNAPSLKCFHCESPPKPGSELKRCSKCKSAHYCTINCQSAAWPLHRRVCGILKRQYNPD